MILRLLLSFFVGLTFVTASYAAIEDQISEFMLDNGMQVVVPKICLSDCVQNYRFAPTVANESSPCETIPSLIDG